MSRGHRRRAPFNQSERKINQVLDRHPLMERCPECGKKRYTNRKAAKMARKRMNSPHVTVYICGDYWHIGHTPYVIRKGYEQRSNTSNEFEGRAS